MLEMLNADWDANNIVDIKNSTVIKANAGLKLHVFA